jgi:hypothetical protein
MIKPDTLSTRRVVQLGFAGAAAVCVTLGAAGWWSTQSVRQTDAAVQVLQQLHTQLGASVRASNDLLLTGNSKSAREGFDRRLSTLHQSLQLHAAAWVDVKAPTEALVQQIEGFGKLPKLSPDNDDALIAYGKLSTVSDEALKALEQLVQLHGDAAAAHARRLLLVMLGGATLALTLVTLCALGVQRRLRRSLGGELEHAQALMQRVGRGDLSPIAVPPRVSPRSVIGGLAAMVDGLRGSITQVQQTASLIGTASGEIASGSQDLSHRTELTAGSLQQTASAMEQLTATVGQTAESARTAQQLAASASSVAQRGGQVVGQVVDTMNAIQGSSAQDRRHHRHHRRHRLPDQHPGAQRRGGSRAGRRGRPRLCRGGQRGAQPGPTFGVSRTRDQGPDQRQRRERGQRHRAGVVGRPDDAGDRAERAARVRHHRRDQRRHARAERRHRPGERQRDAAGRRHAAATPRWWSSRPPRRRR